MLRGALGILVCGCLFQASHRLAFLAQCPHLIHHKPSSANAQPQQRNAVLHTSVGPPQPPTRSAGNFGSDAVHLNAGDSRRSSLGVQAPTRFVGRLSLLPEELCCPCLRPKCERRRVWALGGWGAAQSALQYSGLAAPGRRDSTTAAPAPCICMHLTHKHPCLSP